MFLTAWARMPRQSSQLHAPSLNEREVQVRYWTSQLGSDVAFAFCEYLSCGWQSAWEDIETSTKDSEIDWFFWINRRHALWASKGWTYNACESPRSLTSPLDNDSATSPASSCLLPSEFIFHPGNRHCHQFRPPSSQNVCLGEISTDNCKVK